VATDDEEEEEGGCTVRSDDEEAAIYNKKNGCDTSKGACSTRTGTQLRARGPTYVGCRSVESKRSRPFTIKNQLQRILVLLCQTIGKRAKTGTGEPWVQAMIPVGRRIWGYVNGREREAKF
jgi:hypothetical protein